MLIVSGPVGATTHDGGPHPERPARIGAVVDGLAELGLGDDLVALAPEPASRDELLRVHHPAYLDRLEALARRGGGALDPDTYVTADSYDTARRAAGAGLVALAELARCGQGVAFVVARPPGHHASADSGMGFCLLNNVAVAAAALVEAGNRVAVVDWDVHHGNGSQEIFWDNPSVLVASTHQWPLYPGTGRAAEVGGPAAPGTTVNVPLPPGATGDVLHQAMDRVVGPAVAAFEPDWLLVSCGFDAHRDDPLAGLALSAGDFGDLATLVAGWAPRPGRLALFLEGGYDLTALRRSTAATVGAVLGGAVPTEAPTAGGPGAEAVGRAAEARRQALGG